MAECWRRQVVTKDLSDEELKRIEAYVDTLRGEDDTRIALLCLFVDKLADALRWQRNMTKILGNGYDQCL